ncbi:MAG: peptidoglycan DD-metalloendopeptidase family protein [Archangium sp.]
MRLALTSLVLVIGCAKPAAVIDAGPPKPVAPPAEVEVRAPLRFEQEEILPRDRRLFAITTSLTAASARAGDDALEPFLARGEVIDTERFFYDLYRSRDVATLATHREVALLGVNALQRLWSIAMIGELGELKTDSELLTALAREGDPLVREYAVNALGRLKAPRTAFDALLADEKNDYVRATITAALERLEKPRPLPVTSPVYEPRGRKRLQWFFNSGIEGGEHVERSSEKLPTPPVTNGFVFPHQQYRFSLREAPAMPNFGGPFAHVGEDSGWFLQGLPVHAMADGVVCRVLFDRSWGTLIAIEHVLPGDVRVTSFHAHLHHDIDVSPGQLVVKGQKLGEIGPSTSVENGGYWAHLHTGLEWMPCEKARIAGYDERVKRYADPFWFVLEHPEVPLNR